MAERVPLAHSHAITGCEATLTRRRTGVGEPRGPDGTGERVRRPEALVELRAGEHTPLDERGRGRGEPVLVVRRSEVPARVHALDGVAEPAVEVTGHPRRERRSERSTLPVRMEHGFVDLHVDGPEPLDATEVVYAVHGPHSSTIVPTPVARPARSRGGATCREPRWQERRAGPESSEVPPHGCGAHGRTRRPTVSCGTMCGCRLACSNSDLGWISKRPNHWSSTRSCAQRRRLLDAARDLVDDQWTSSTRCTDWDARELVLHVLDATDACRTTLTRERSVFGGSFDPNSSPNRFVESRAGEPVAATLEQLDVAIIATADAIEAQRARTPTPQMTAVWGQEVDWRLFVTHMFWDGWIHERDLLLPLGREPVASDAETRLAAAYGLHTAAIMIGMLAIPFDATLRLEGTGSGAYRVVADGLDVTVSVSPLETTDGSSNGNAIAVTDALAGRGPELGTVLDASPDVVDALAEVGTFLRGQAAPPPIPGR